MKLDNAEFATKFDVISSGLLDAIKYALLEGKDATIPVRAELYKLNIYGKFPPLIFGRVDY